MKILLSLIIMWTSYAASMKDPKGCPKDWYENENSCYKFMVLSAAHQGHNWNDARESCLAYEGDLLSLGSKPEMDFINKITARFAYHKQHLWIGLNDLDEENKFAWSDGTPFSRNVYNNWGQGEPNNRLEEHCVELFQHVWNDNMCTKKFGYICEKPREFPKKPVVCTTGWITHFQSCYKFSSQKKNWNDAKEDCNNDGGYLVKIDDMDENHFIKLQQLRSKFPRWIGLSDRNEENHFTWVYDETVPMHTQWAINEPNNHDYTEDCVSVYGHPQAGYWNDESCKAWNKYICERNEGDWYAQGCYEENKKKVFKEFRKFRIAGLVDKCKEEAERLHLDVFGVGFAGKKRITYTVCVTTKTKKARKKNRYGTKYEDGCKIDAHGLGSGSKPNVYFVYTRIKHKTK